MHTQTQVPASYHYRHKLCSQKHSHTWGPTIRAETCIVTQPCILAMQVPMSAVSCHWHTEVTPTWTLWTYSWKPLLENSLLECLQLNSFIIRSTKKGGLCRRTRPGERREACAWEARVQPLHPVQRCRSKSCSYRLLFCKLTKVKGLSSCQIQLSSAFFFSSFLFFFLTSHSTWSRGLSPKTQSLPGFPLLFSSGPYLCTFHNKPRPDGTSPRFWCSFLGRPGSSRQELLTFFTNNTT